MTAERALCAVHPELAAAQECPRCGSHACEACWSASDALCGACVARGHGAVPVAWEGARWSGFLVTAMDVLFRPVRTFSRLGEGGVLRALGFSVVVWSLQTLLFAALAASSDRSLMSYAGLAGWVLLAGVLAPVLEAAAMWLPTRILSVPPTVGRLVRVCAYAQATHLVLGHPLTWLAAARVARAMTVRPTPQVIGVTLALAAAGAVATSSVLHIHALVRAVRPRGRREGVAVVLATIAALAVVLSFVGAEIAVADLIDGRRWPPAVTSR